MITELVPFANFKGIEKTVVASPHNTFDELTNLRNDRVLGGLAPRYGYKSYENLTFQPDAFIQNKFNDFESLIIAGNGAIWANPAVLSDSLLTTLTDITSPRAATIGSVSGTTLGLTAGLAQTKYCICENLTQNKFAVVLADTSSTSKLMSRDVQAEGWIATDAVRFHRTDLRLSAVVNESLLRPNVDVNDGGFTPATNLFDNINDRTDATFIVSQVLRNTITYSRIDPSSDELNIGFISTGPDLWSVLDDGNSPNDNNFVSSAGITGYSAFATGFTNPGSFINSNPILVTIRLRYFRVVPFSPPREFTVEIREGATFSTSTVKYTAQVVGYADGVFRDTVISVPTGSIVNPDNLYVMFIIPTPIPILTEQLWISHIKVEVPGVETPPSDFFEVDLEDLSTSVAPDGTKNAVLSLMVRTTVATAPASVLLRLKDGSSGTTIKEGFFTAEYNYTVVALEIPVVEITDWADLRVRVQVTPLYVNRDSQQVQIKYLDLTVPTIVSTVPGSLGYIVESYPKFHQIDLFGNLYLDGVSHQDRGLWVGKILSRNFFGDNQFSFDGMYVTGLIEDFKQGAFQEVEQHIQVKGGTTAATGTETLTANGATDTSGNWTLIGGAANELDAIQTAGDGKQTVNSAIETTGLRIDFTNPTIEVSREAAGTIQINTGATSEGFLEVRIYESNVFKGTVTNIRIIGATTRLITFDTTLVNNYSNVQVMLLGRGGPIAIDYVEMRVPRGLVETIQLIEDTNFSFNFCLIEDGFNRTRLIYNEDYGDVQDEPASYVLSNRLNLVLDGANSKVVGIRLGTFEGETICRRVTGIEVFASVSGSDVWRFVKTVNIDESDWQFANGEYFIEFFVGNEINTGAIYEDLYGLNEFTTNLQKTNGFIQEGDRSYAISPEDKRTVVYSPVNGSGRMTSVLPLANSLLFAATPGEIVAMSAVGGKVLVFKNNSHFAFRTQGVNEAPRPETLSKSIGLSSPSGIAAGAGLVFFPSQDGIYATDGFKTELINETWIDHYRRLPPEPISSSIGFYDIFSDSYFWFVRVSTNAIDMWAYDTKTRYWRKEDFRYVYQGASILRFGFIKYVGSSVNNRILFADDMSKTTSTYMQIFEYPRADILFTDRIKSPRGLEEVPISCLFKTNPYENEQGEDESLFLDDLFIRTNVLIDLTPPLPDEDNPPIGGQQRVIAGDLPVLATIEILDNETVIKTVTSELGRELIPLRYDKSLSQFAVRMSFNAIADFVIRTFGVYIKRAKRSGSGKQTLEI